MRTTPVLVPPIFISCPSASFSSTAFQLIASPPLLPSPAQLLEVLCLFGTTAHPVSMGISTEQKQNGTPSSNAAKYNIPDHFIGGNKLSSAPPSKVKDFVASHGGHTVITNVSLAA